MSDKPASPAEAALRLGGIARFLLKTMPKKPATLRPVQ